MNLLTTITLMAAEAQNPGPGGGDGGEGGVNPLAGVCPKAPPGAQTPTNEITSYVLWGVIALFAFALLVGLGAVVAGRLFGMAHASKVGVISLVVVFVSVVAYLVLPGMLNAVLGDGCI